MFTALPLARNLPRYIGQTPIIDTELASKGGRQHNLRAGLLPKDDPLLLSPIPTGEEWAIPNGEPIDSFFYGTSFVLGNLDSGTKLAAFQYTIIITQTVALNAVEEWTINSLNDYLHPFFIHANDSYVVKINGEAVTPFWADTLPVLPKGSVTFRMRFKDFTRKYVWYRHALDYEDLDMMQLVDVVG